MDSGCFSCCSALKTWSPTDWFVDKINRIDEKSEQVVEWPSDPKHYQWKGTISSHDGTWHVLAYCKLRKEDVLVEIKSAKDDTDIEHFTNIATKLMNIRHPNLMTPVHAFAFKSEIYVVYPRHSGGPISEVLASHYPNGIPSEDIVASILYDTALGLQNLHKQQQCHRNIRADSLHIDIDDGMTLLSNFGTLKSISWRRASKRKNTAIDPIREPFTDPLLLLGLDENATWYTADIYAFGITALQLTYGQISTDLYGKRCPFSKSFETLIKDCCGPLNDRISVNKLVQHKFFNICRSDRDSRLNDEVSSFFGHILKTIEQRVDPSLPAPPSLILAAHSSSNLIRGISQISQLSQLSGLGMNTDGTFGKTDEENLAFCIEKSLKEFKETPNGSNGPTKGGNVDLEGTGTATNQHHYGFSWSFSTSTIMKDAKQAEVMDVIEDEARELLTLEMEEGQEDTGTDGYDSTLPDNTEIILGLAGTTPKGSLAIASITPKGSGSAKPKAYKTRDKDKKKDKKSDGKRHTQSELRKWMEKHNVFERTLYTKLSNSNVKTLKQLKALKHRDLNWMLQSVRVARLSKSKGQTEKQAVDAELANFEILVVRTKRKSSMRKKALRESVRETV